MMEKIMKEGIEKIESYINESIRDFRRDNTGNDEFDSENLVSRIRKDAEEFGIPENEIRDYAKTEALNGLSRDRKIIKEKRTRGVWGWTKWTDSYLSDKDFADELIEEFDLKEDGEIKEGQYHFYHDRFIGEEGIPKLYVVYSGSNHHSFPKSVSSEKIKDDLGEEKAKELYENLFKEFIDDVDERPVYNSQTNVIGEELGKRKQLDIMLEKAEEKLEAGEYETATDLTECMSMKLNKSLPENTYKYDQALGKMLGYRMEGYRGRWCKTLDEAKREIGKEKERRINEEVEFPEGFMERYESIKNGLGDEK